MGADVNARDDQGNAPLRLVKKPKLLLRFGADPTVKNRRNSTASVLKQFQFIQELYRVSRPGAFTPRLRKQFSEVEKIIRAKTWGSRGEDFPCTSGRHSSPFSKNPHADGARHHRSLVFTDEAPSLKMEHLTLQTNTRSVSMSYYDLEMGLPASSAPTPLTAVRETLGDYGFFDEDDVDATVHLEEQFQL
eukprot:gene7498-5388_t